MDYLWDLPNKTIKAKKLREKRARLEYLLRRCWISDTRDTYTFRIEMINLTLQEMGEGLRGNKHKATF
jgi:hypothetical protein